MSEIVSAAIPAQSGLPWGLWWRQGLSIIRLELRKGFRRPWFIALLALSPLFILTLRAVLPEAVRDASDVASATEYYAAFYQAFILRILVFLGCVAVFGNLLRRETLDRSLHYYFLSPVRRELLVVAKYVTGLMVTLLFFGIATVGSFFLMYLPHESVAVRQFLSGPGMGHLASYLLVTLMACVGYGAVFLFFGFFFKSPVLPALAVFTWEGIHFLLPPLLKKVSVVHYLQSLCPVPMDEGPLALLADAPSPWVAIPGLFVLAVVLVTVSALKIRRMEISYDES